MSAYKTDAGGIALKCNDMKITFGEFNWKTKLSLCSRPSASVCIETYSLPRVNYIEELLEKGNNSIRIIANENFSDKAKAICEKFSNVQIRLLPHIHSKLAIVSPCTVLLTSANFGESKWIESGVSMHSNTAYAEALAGFESLWKTAQKIE